MQFTANLKATDPHDAPAIAPDVVPVTWADKVLADITRDASTIQPESLRRDGQPHAPSSAVAVAAPTVDTTFRATDVRPARAKRPRSKWVGQVIMIFMFALVSAFAAGLWQHYGGPAREVIAEWTPLITEWTQQFTAASSQEQAAPAEQTAAPAQQTTAATDQSASPAAATAAPAAASLPLESADPIQSMQRDLAAMGQQIEQLKASLAELKASQQPPAPTVARSTEAKPVEVKPPAPAMRPRVSAVQPPPPPQQLRPAPPPVRRPPPVQASAAPMQLAAPPPPPPQAAADDGEVVVRPPMPLRWGSSTE